MAHTSNNPQRPFITIARRTTLFTAAMVAMLCGLASAQAQPIRGVANQRPSDQQDTEVLRINQLGARWVRVLVVQADLQGTARDIMLGYLDRLKGAGLSVLVVLTSEIGGLDAHDPNPDVMRTAVQAVVDTFDTDRDRIDAYEIWNEPDVPRTQINSDQFINLLNAIWTGTSAPTHGTIVTGGQWTVQRYDGDAGELFISAMRDSYDRSGLPGYPFHAIGVHTYGFDDGTARTNISYHIGLVYQRFPGAPVWATEFGYGTETPGHSEAGQADFINSVVNEYRSIPADGGSRIDALFYYSLVNTNEGGEASTMGACRSDRWRLSKVPGFRALAAQYGGPGISVIQGEIICRDQLNCTPDTEIRERPLQIRRSGGVFNPGVQAIILPPQSCSFRLDEFIGYGCSGPSQSSTSAVYLDGGILAAFAVDPSPYGPGQYSGRMVSNCDGSATVCINVDLSE